MNSLSVSITPKGVLKSSVVNKEQLDKIKIAPIIISPDKDLKELAINIKKTIDDQNKSTIIIASSDFTHYGMNYGYVPFTTDVKKNLYNLDKSAIDLTEVRKMIELRGFKIGHVA